MPISFLPHEPWSPSENSWQTDVGLQTKTQITRLTLDERPHAMNAALALIQAYRAEHEGRILVIDAAVRDRANEWANALASIGMAWQPGSTTLNQQPLHQALVRAAGLAQGMSAWSLSSLRSLSFSSTVPFLDDMFRALNTPVKRRGDLNPTLWCSKKFPDNFTYSVDRVPLHGGLVFSVKPHPRLLTADRRKRLGRLKRRSGGSHVCFTPGRRSCPVKTVICSSVPLSGALRNPAPANHVVFGHGLALMVDFLIDVGALDGRRAPFDTGIGALHALIEALNDIKSHLGAMELAFVDEGPAFIDLLEHIGATVSLSHQSSRTHNLHVLTPEEALGCTAESILLVGMDVDAWSMKSSTVPWLDAHSRLELGLFHTDLAVRRGRHHLRHLLNAGRYLVVFDSSAEEGVAERTARRVVE